MKLKCVRANNGGEYRGPFEQYCKDHGIKLKKTVPKTPQQNGVAERMNRTITKRIRYMFSYAKLPKAFWGETMRTAVDLINLSPLVPLSGDIPERVWKGKDVSYKQLWDPVNKKIVRSRDVIFFKDQTIEDIEKEDKPKPIARNDNVYEPELPARNVNDGGDANTNVPPINTELRRSVRQSHPSQKYPPHEYVLLTDGGEPERKEIRNLKKELSKSFTMKDLGAVKQILGIKIIRDRKNGKLWLSQQKYIEKVLERFNMGNAKPVGTPLAGHFKLSKKQCPTIGVVSRYLSNSGKEHWQAVKWILKYLRGTSRFCLCFGAGKPVLNGYTDADMAGDVDSRKSTSRYMMTFAKGPVSWQSKLQKCVALSSTEAEYIAITEAGKELLWMKRFLQELDLNQERYVVHSDSQSVIHLSKNLTFHSSSKHIEVRYH
ncbi:hypothetical protein L6164_007122 [Bauhinia variegata]|uniref:Uncharacterized protein n=1 Tax=Bauhinia variegata TaxID=167791 RepID=A0ACB9PW26_BAUVA|nr:hypothetical protein L6164_007122 [Bauhinia variegata]